MEEGMQEVFENMPVSETEESIPSLQAVDEMSENLVSTVQVLEVPVQEQRHVVATEEENAENGNQPNFAEIPEIPIPTPVIECAGCKRMIKDRHLLKTMDLYWHEDCLKCSCCDCRLGEVGSSLYTKANLLLCKRDYLRLFGASGSCTICKKTIPAFEMVMKVRQYVYHLECFACQQCRQRFCVGDKFYLCENRILCEYDFEEQNLITSIQRGYNALSHMRKQAETLSDISSGYGSPSPGTM